MIKYLSTILSIIILSICLSFSYTLAQTPDHTPFFDDFENGELSGWDASFAGNAVEVITLDGNNVLHITGEQNDFVSLGFSGDFSGATAIEARIQLLDLGPNNGSVVFNLMSENPGHASGYSALISTGGASFLDRNDNFRDIEPSTRHDFQVERNRWYHIRFESTSQTLTLSVNHEVVQIAQLEVLETGEPVFIFDRGMQVYLDDVRVEHPDAITAVANEPDEPAVIGQVTVGSGVLFRADHNTQSPTVPRNSSLNTYEVIGIVENGGEVQINGVTSTEWYYIHIPDSTPRYAYVSAAVITRFERYDEPATLTEIFEPSPTPNSIINSSESSAIDLPNDRLVPVDVVRETAPRTYRWDVTREVNIQGSDGTIRRELRTFDTRIIRVLPENIGTIIDVYGNPIQHGVYSPDNPPPIRPELLPQPLNINGSMAEYGYVVGIFSFGVSPSGSDGSGAITFFAEGTNTPVHVEFKMDEMFNNVSIGVQGSNGSEVGTPADNRGRISVGNNPTTNLLINYENRTLTIPTDNGPLVIREGDEIMLAILWNQEISNYARHWGDQMPSEWSETVFDNDPNNDPQDIFVEHMGLIVSDQSTRAEVTPTATEVVSTQATPTATLQEPDSLPSTSIDLPNDRLVPVDVVRETAPRTYRWELRTGPEEQFLKDTRIITINAENMGTLVDIYGNPIQHGVYTPDNPPPVRPELLPIPFNINGESAEYGYVVGIFSFGVSRTQDLVENRVVVNGQGAVTFFAEGTNAPVNIFFPLDDTWSNASVGVQAPDGSEVGTPSDMAGILPFGSNPSRDFVIDYDNRTITFPTENGQVVIREGDEVMLAILWNQEASNYARTWGDQLPSEWSTTVFDDDRSNDPEIIYTKPTGIIVSDRSTRSDE